MRHITVGKNSFVCIHETYEDSLYSPSGC